MPQQIKRETQKLNVYHEFFITIPGFVDCLVIAINILCKASVSKVKVNNADNDD